MRNACEKIFLLLILVLSAWRNVDAAEWDRIDMVHPRILETEASWDEIPELMKRDGHETDARYLLRGKSRIWVHFTANNPEAKAQSVVLVHPMAVSTRFEVYTIDKLGRHSVGVFGDAVADVTPQIWHRTPAIALELQPGVTEFYIRVAKDNPQCIYFSIYGERAFHAMHARDLALLCTLIGVIVVMLLYNVFIYLSLRYDYYLYYVGFGAVFYVCYVIISGLPQSLLFPQLEIRNFSIYMAAFFGCLSFFFICKFVTSFLKVETFFPGYYRITQGFAYSVFFLIPLIIIEGLTTQTAYSVKIVNALGAIIGTWAYYLGFRVAFLRYPPAIYFLIAFTTLVTGNTYSNIVIDGFLPLTDAFDFAALLGGCCEILLLSISLGRRVKAEDAASKQKIQELADVLDQRVEERTRFARSILTNISVGLLRIEAQGVIAGDFSRSSLELFNVTEMKDKHIWDLLNYDQDAEGLSILKSLIELIVGEDQINLLANEEHLPRFHRQISEAGERVIELNWSPFLKGGTVEAILLLARDVTYVRKLEEEHQKRTNEANFIMAVARHGVTRMRQYLADEGQTVHRIQELLQNVERRRPELMRLLHTVKGNTRTMGLSEISRLAHRMEEELNTALLDEINACFQIYQDKLDKYFAAETQRINAPLLALEGKVIELEKHRETREIAEDMHWIIASMQNNQLDELGAPLQDMSQELAHQLHKAAPTVDVKGPGILVSSRLLHRLRSILNHLVRNSLDHGIEMPAVRAAQKKPAAGRLFLTFSVDEDRMIARFWDDGAGLNLQKIWEKGLSLGLFPADQALRLGDVAELIFQAGLTSKAEADTISGRGIGMDAVRDLCKELNGTIRVTSEWDLSRSFRAGVGSMPVVFELTLPLSLFILRKAAA